jgi:hypothetical protein
VYLGVLLPKIIFSSKVGLLTNNYLKAYRKEKSMLIVNAVSIAVSLILSLVAAYIVNDLMLILVFAVAVTMFNSILSEIIVMRIIKIKLLKEFILDTIMTIIFMVAVNCFSFWIAFLVYAVALVIYCIIVREHLKVLFEKIFARFIRRRQ